MSLFPALKSCPNHQRYAVVGLRNLYNLFRPIFGCHKSSCDAANRSLNGCLAHVHGNNNKTSGMHCAGEWTRANGEQDSQCMTVRTHIHLHTHTRSHIQVYKTNVCRIHIIFIPRYHMHRRIHMYTQERTHTRICVHIYVSECVCVRVGVRVCGCVRVYVRGCACVWIVYANIVDGFFKEIKTWMTARLVRPAITGV